MAIATLLIAGAVALAQPADAPDAANTPDAELRTEVRKLVRQLNADTIAEREAAELRLLKLGVPALAHLPEVTDSMPQELRDRLQRVLDKLQADQAKMATQSGRVTLHVAGEPLSKVVKSLQEQTGNKIVDFRDFRGQEITDAPITLDLADAPFWQAMDAVLDQAALTTYPFAIDQEGNPIRGVAFVAAGGEGRTVAARSARSCYEGPFRFEPTQVLARRGLRDPAENSLQIDIDAAWEPRLAPITMALLNESLVAMDDTGQSLTAVSKGRISIGVHGQATTFPMRFNLPDRDARELKSVKGMAEGLIPGQVVTFRFDDLSGKKKIQQKQAGATVLLDQVRKNRAVWEVRVIVRFESPAGALESHLMDWVLSNEAYLETPDGKRVEVATTEKTRELADEFGVAYLFGLDGDIAGHTFVYKTPAALVNTEIPFEFKDLPLP